MSSTPHAYTRSEVVPKFMSPSVVLSLAALLSNCGFSLFPLKINSFSVSFENKFLVHCAGIRLTVEFQVSFFE